MTELEQSFLRFCADVKSILNPKEVPFKKTKIGGEGDGSYVICDIPDLKYDALYSYGSDDNIIFEKSFYDRYKVDSFVYDHTIDGITDKPDYVHFFKEGVWVEKTNDMNTIESHVIANKHQDSRNLFMQMDIEGCEWNVLSSPIINKFSQIVVEFHLPLVFLENNMQLMNLKYNTILNTLKNLDDKFYCVHIHGNNCLLQPWFDIELPRCMEITYLRKDLFNDEPPTIQRSFPTELDTPNDSKKPDMTLTWWPLANSFK
jgi:hypothetical protein